MSQSALIDSIFDAFVTGWKDETPIAWPNVQFDTEKQTEFVRLTVIPSMTVNADVGGTLRREYGNIIVQVFTKTGIGIARPNELVDTVLIILEQKKFGEYIETKRGSVSYAGTQTDDAWWQANVVIPFRYDSH